MFYNRDQKVNIDREKDFKFHALAWHAEDFLDETDADEGEIPIPNYCIKCFGVDEFGHSVSLSIKGFKPYFYVKVDDSWTRQSVKVFHEHLSTLLPYTLANSIVSAKLVKKKDFWGFTNFRDFQFVKLSFANHQAMRSINYKLQQIKKDGMKIPRLGQKGFYFKTYESNIDPFIRFIHIMNLEPTGWIKLAGKTFSKYTEMLNTTCQIDLEANWKMVLKHDCLSSAPFLIASFDIECKSNNSIDFPIAKKDYKKLATELYEVVTRFVRKEVSEYNKKIILLNSLLYAFDLELKGNMNDDTKNFPYHLHVSKLVLKEAKNIEKIRNLIDIHIDDFYTLIIGKSARYLILCKENKDTEKQKHLVIASLLKESFDTFFPALEGDPIIQIGTTFHKYGDRSCCFKHIVTLKSCDPIDGVEVKACDSEQELLLEWKNMINKYNPDIITGYNIFGFDFSYIHDRVIDLGIKKEFMIIGRIIERECEFKTQQLSSAALGENKLDFIDMPGRVLIDILKVIRRDHNLDMYKLDFVAKHFMGMQKNDVSPREIFRLQDGSSSDRKRIAEYCIQDCELCNNLMIKLEILANNMGMSNVCLVPLSFIFMRGQGIKIYSLVLKQCLENGYVIPVINKNPEVDGKPDDDSYEGAIVLEPQEGIYVDDPVSVVDYASLYPSSMISGNLSHDCFVIDKKYDNLPNVSYTDIEYDQFQTLENKTKVKIGVSTSRFVELPNGEKGIVPRILMKLLEARKSTRKQVKLKQVNLFSGEVHVGFFDTKASIISKTNKEELYINPNDIESVTDFYNDFQKIVLDGLQLAYKVTANSLYGQIGAKTSQIHLKDIAACTTAIGRKMILLAKDFLEKEYQANIIYGDSVTSYTPVLIRDNMGNINLHTIDTLAERYGNSKWLPCNENGRQTKDACELYGIETWTDNGWTALHRVIRHTLAPHKKIVRVLTHTGLVDVTDDHSLLDFEGHPVTSKDVSIGTPLLHHIPPVCGHNDETFSEVEAQVMGFFFGDGLNNANDDILKRYLSLCEKAYPEFKCVVMSTKKSSGVDKISPRCEKEYGLTSKFVEKYRLIMYDGNAKIIPCQIFNSPIHIKEAFWRGLYDADGDKDKNGYIRIDQKSMLSASHIALLASYLGKNVSINTRVDKPNIFRLTTTTRSQRKMKSTIKKMYEVPYTGHVYDLTTDNHHFAAGVGRLILHNTDSVFATFPNKDEHGNKLKGKAAIMKSIETAQHASEKIKSLLPKPHDLEYEKTFWPFMLLAKKRYLGNKYEFNDIDFKMNSMGTVLKRRDNAPIVKHMYGGIVDIILNKQDIVGSIKYLQQQLQAIIDGKFPLQQFIITKSLSGDYKNPSSQAHKVLADRIADRDPGNKPQVNDRIPFVFINVPNISKDALQGERIENPDFVVANKLTIDYTHYITNQIMTPLLQIYALVAEHIKSKKYDSKYYQRIYKELLAENNGDVKKTKTKFYDIKEKCVKELLFDGILNSLNRTKTNNRAITDFFKPS